MATPSLLIATLMSPPGLGKTSDMLRTIPRGVIIGPPGSTAMSERLLGFSPTTLYEVNDLGAATKVLKYIAKNPTPGAYGVGLDDLSLLCKETARHLEAKFPKEGSGVFDYFNAIMAAVIDAQAALWAAALALGGLGITTCHPRAMDDKCRGGPLLDGASWKATPFWTKHSHILALARRTDKRPLKFKGTYMVAPGHAAWETKDRTHTFSDVSPMSLGEHLRAYGMYIPRAEGLEWMEEWVEAVAVELADRGIDPKALLEIKNWIDAALPEIPHSIRSEIRFEGFARWEIRQNQTDYENLF